ncbi:hypothetical protein [Agromyces mariniharenae]|uniref:hypothetical protein n=1 Tax=Agromyces mariniharenae TaxID=2604423 RepID=UPI001652E099|nr:hypothetical protein [Agromyces mariniharenae]
MDDRIESGSDADLAIQRAMEAAELRAGDSLGSTTASVVEDHEPSAAEAGELGGAADGD